MTSMLPEPRAVFDEKIARLREFNAQRLPYHDRWKLVAAALVRHVATKLPGEWSLVEAADNYVVATSSAAPRSRYYIIGQELFVGRGLVRGVVRRRPGAKRVTWLINGQASTGTVQVVHWGESRENAWVDLVEMGDEALLRDMALQCETDLFSYGEQEAADEVLHRRLEYTRNLLTRIRDRLGAVS